MLPVIPFGGAPWGTCNPTDYEDLTVPNTIGGTTLTKLAVAHVGVFIRNEGQNVRFRADGGVPVTGGGTGVLLFDTEMLFLNNVQAKQFLAIADQASSSTLRVTYFKGG